MTNDQCRMAGEKIGTQTTIETIETIVITGTNDFLYKEKYILYYYAQLLASIHILNE